MPTQKEIARKIGVSQVTVSRVLNNFAVVDSKTRERVLRALKQHYVPNVNARNLVMKQSGKLCIMIPGAATFHNYFFAGVLQGICSEVQSLYCGLQFVNIGDPDRDRELAGAIQSGDRFMIIHFSTARPFVAKVTKYLSHLKKSYILIQSHGFGNYPFVTIDNKAGGRMATEHLIKCGHRNIAFAGAGSRAKESIERRDGYRSAMKAARLKLREYALEDKSFTSMEKLLGLMMSGPDNARPTAVFAWSDMVALKLSYAAARKQLSIPDSLSMVGFDDFSPFATLIEPALTTIHHPLFEIGATAVKRLFTPAAHMPRQQKLLPVLVERNSVRKV